jgi:ribonuclease D
VLVGNPEEVATIAERMAAAPLVAFDLEFLTADRLIPTLCVVQVSWVSVELDAGTEAIVAAEPEIRVIDALAVDVRPILAALAAHPHTVAHAARQDLGIVGRLGIAMPNMIDTQVMAAFAGVGDQVGLAALSNELLGVTLAKEQQWTDWAKRPLSDAQLAYAAADVRHLPAIYAKLAARLGERLKWACAESTEVAAEALAAVNVTPDEAWRAIGGLRGLDATALAVVRALAAWRLRVALELDRPLGWVLAEKTIIDFARHRPAEADAVRSYKGLAAPARQRADELVALIADAVPGAALAIVRAPSARAQRWSDMLLAIVQLAAEQSGVAARLLATRSDAEEVARTVDELGLEAARGLPAFTSWRYEVLGTLWEGWLAGTLALVGERNATGIALVPSARDRGPE